MVMAVFVAISVVLALAVLAAVLWPLRRQSPVLLPVAVLGMALASFALYSIVGTPAALAPAATQAPTTLDEAIVALEATLKRNPNEPEGWRLLGRSYAAQERLAEAQDAFAEAVKLMPDEPTLLVEAAQSRLYANPQRLMDAEGVALLERALAIDPGHQRALWFLGVAQRQAQQPAEAARTWESLMSLVDPAAARSLRVQIDAARTDAGLPPLATEPEGRATATDSPVLTVKVALDDEFASRADLPDDAVVFVIARVPGSPMPVAVERHALRDLPLSVTLDDSDSLMPTRKLSSLDEVEVLSRISVSGDASRQEGDLESAVVTVMLPTTEEIRLVLGPANN